jgi:flagellar biosynthetic protein FliR
MTITLSETTLIALLLCAARVLAWTTLAPPFATGGLPHAVKPMVAVALSLAVTPLAAKHVPPADAVSISFAVLENVVIGAALGFGTRLLFSAVESAGGLIDLFGGFSLAFALDPFGNNNNSVFARFYGLLATTLLFVSQAHLVIIAGFLRSFQALPLDGHLDLAKLDSQLVPGLTQLFLAALQIAGPLIVVLVVADIALGLLNRIAPQLNVFSVSFPLKIMLTLGLVGLGFVLLPRTITHLADNAVTFVGNVTG